MIDRPCPLAGELPAATGAIESLPQRRRRSILARLASAVAGPRTARWHPECADASMLLSAPAARSRPAENWWPTRQLPQGRELLSRVYVAMVLPSAVQQIFCISFTPIRRL